MCGEGIHEWEGRVNIFLSLLYLVVQYGPADEKLTRKKLRLNLWPRTISLFSPKLRFEPHPKQELLYFSNAYILAYVNYHYTPTPRVQRERMVEIWATLKNIILLSARDSWRRRRRKLLNLAPKIRATLPQSSIRHVTIEVAAGNRSSWIQISWSDKSTSHKHILTEVNRQCSACWSHNALQQLTTIVHVRLTQQAWMIGPRSWRVRGHQK